jgi:two-component system, sensor histidine kinase YesM
MIRALKKIFEDMSLKNKTFLFNTLTIVLSLFTLGFFATSIFSSAIIEKAEKSSAMELELIDRNLDTMASSFEDYIRVIASDYRLQEQLLQYEQNPGQVNASLKALQIRTALSEIMSNITSPNTQVTAASVLSANRHFIYYSTININKLGEIFGDNFLDKVVQKQTPVWTDLFHLEYTDRLNIDNTVAVAKLVIDKNSGTKTGVVVLFINEKNISRVFPIQKSNAHDKYYIIDANGMVISSQNKGDLYQGLDSVLGIRQEYFKQLMQQGKTIAKQNNKDLLYSIQIFDKLGWKVVSVVSLEEITAENSKIQSIIFIVGILCLLFAFIASYIISHTVTKPIHKLSRIMKGIIDGDMSIRVETEIRGELGILAKGFNKLMDRIESLLQEILSEQKTRREFEFKLIQSQIKPHFLYNSLETIISLNKLGRYEDAISTAKSLASFYRSSLSKGNDMIKISEEVDLTANYLAIQKMRYSNYMEYSIQMENDVVDLEIPKLSLQPLVENSIYHGLKPKEGKGKLEIKGYLSDGVINIEVYDNGVGIPEDKIHTLLDESLTTGKSDDFGLASVNNRIKLHYGNQYGICIQSEIGVFTKVTLTIPSAVKKG